MPNCFQLVDKVTGQVEVLATVDEKLCAHFGVPVHPTRYYCQWYVIIGFALAMGKSYDDVRNQFKRDALSESENHLATSLYWDRMIAIVDWLEANYIPDAFVSRK